MKTPFFTAMSLDGFLATEDDSVDWLFPLGNVNDTGYPDFIADVGALVATCRRNTIRQIVDSNPERFVVVLAMIAGISRALDRARLQSLGDDLSLLAVLAISIAGVAGLVIMVPLVILVLAIATLRSWLMAGAVRRFGWPGDKPDEAGVGRPRSVGTRKTRAACYPRPDR